MPSQDNTNLAPTAIQPLDFLKTQRANDPRIGTRAKSIHPSEVLDAEPGWVLLGHPDDEGIRLNYGRPGAGLAPANIRKFFYNLVDAPSGTKIYDLGDDAPLATLEDRHAVAQKSASLIFKRHRLIALGGGHDYGYPDGKAFLDSFGQGKNVLIINLDAHLDLRPSDPSHHSGTPFRRLCQEDSSFHLVEFGIQNSFASQEQLDFAKGKNISIITFEDRRIRITEVLQKIQNASDLFLSVDIDAFSSSIAPGASAAWPIGLSWEDAEPIFQAAFRSRALRGLGIYEVSPPLDVGDFTSKFAAQIIDRALRLSL